MSHKEGRVHGRLWCVYFCDSSRVRADVRTFISSYTFVRLNDKAEPVSKRSFPMIDMCQHRKVANPEITVVFAVTCFENKFDSISFSRRGKRFGPSASISLNLTEGNAGRALRFHGATLPV